MHSAPLTGVRSVCSPLPRVHAESKKKKNSHVRATASSRWNLHVFMMTCVAIDLGIVSTLMKINIYARVRSIKYAFCSIPVHYILSSANLSVLPLISSWKSNLIYPLIDSVTTSYFPEYAGVFGVSMQMRSFGLHYAVPLVLVLLKLQSMQHRLPQCLQALLFSSKFCNIQLSAHTHLVVV